MQNVLHRPVAHHTLVSYYRALRAVLPFHRSDVATAKRYEPGGEGIQGLLNIIESIPWNHERRITAPPAEP
jgi:hypothetical protein